jgi:auxin efflux carrier family protein
MGLLQLFVTASMPVLNVLLVSGVGSFLATENIGILSKECTKHLNNVGQVFYFPFLMSDRNFPFD